MRRVTGEVKLNEFDCPLPADLFPSPPPPSFLANPVGVGYPPPLCAKSLVFKNFNLQLLPKYATIQASYPNPPVGIATLLVGTASAMAASWFQSTPMVTKVRGLRILLVVSIVYLCSLAKSGLPGFALALTWGSNGLFVAAYLRGVLHLPLFLERVHPIEPVIYRHLGVGLAKRIVETQMWPLVCGNELPPKMRTRNELLDFTEQAARGAEICHAATFALASIALLICFAVGNSSAAVWILAFNIVLNGYPVMLQRSHRWRIQQLRARTKPESLKSDETSGNSKSIQVPTSKSLERTRE